jgi:hypothetical protein
LATTDSSRVSEANDNDRGTLSRALCDALWEIARYLSDVMLDYNESDSIDLNEEFAFVTEDVARDYSTCGLHIDYFSRGLVSFTLTDTYSRLEPAELLVGVARRRSDEGAMNVCRDVFTCLLLTHTLVDSASTDADLEQRVWVCADWSQPPKQVPASWFESAFAVSPRRRRTELRWDGTTFLQCEVCGAWRHGNEEIVRAYEHVQFTCAQGLYARRSPCTSPNDPESLYE